MAGRRRAILGIGAGLLLAAGALAWAWPGLAASPLGRGRAAYARRDWAASEALALAALKARPDDPEALLLLARASGRLGRDDVAEAIYARPGLPKLEAEDCLAIAAGHHRRGDARAALRRLEQGLGLDPDHADILHLLALYRDSLGQPTRAEGLAARLAAQPGQAARGDLLLGTLRDRLADPAGAAEALERALKTDPTLEGLTPKPPEARKLLARDHLKLGRPDLARTDLLPVDDPEAAWLLGRAWLQEGRVDLAASALARSGGYGSDRPTDPEPAPFVGSAECASCHESIFKAQQGSRHARTFHAGPDLARLPWPKAPLPDPVDPGAIRHRAIVDGARVDWETRVGDEAARAAIRFAFGSGDRGVTPVGVDAKGRFRELRLSHYADAWDLTTGHPAKPDPMTADGALGQALGPDELRTCLGCHTTDFRASRDRVGPTAKEAGIGCERCHGPGGNHLKAAALGFSDPAIARPKRATAAQVTALCAGCHSPGDRPVSRDDPASARFQGTTLTWSRCYQESQGRLSCVTCHDPHHDAAKGPATYEAKCLACHVPKPTRETPDPAGLPSLAPEPTGHPCPVSPTRDCIRCHMPTTTAATRHTTFADHHIRIHRPGETMASSPMTHIPGRAWRQPPHGKEASSSAGLFFDFDRLEPGISGRTRQKTVGASLEPSGRETDRPG